MRVYQLAPLNADDIRLAAKANGKDPDTIIRQFEDAKALPLATIPITLEMLLQTDEMTDSRVDLYRSGIRRLCGLSDESVPLTEKARLERFEIASRLAAVMVLGNKYSIDIDGNTALNDSSLGIQELLLDGDLEDEERLLRATLNCALFQGTTQRIWAHQSFVEYLAAHFLGQDSVSVDKLLQITTTPDGRFAPQLHETLRWLMDMRHDFLKEVIKRQPMLALMSDLSHLNKRQYRNFVKTLLSLDDPYAYSNETWELRKYRATHTNGKSILLPYLKDTERHIHLRQFVFRLLECHGFSGMEDELVDLALNEYEYPVLRWWAARGLQKVGSVEAKLELKPYVFGREDDPDDEIKGYALRALWPCHLTVDELFNALTPPKQESYVGSYRVFLIENGIVNDLSPTDLPTALMWVAAQPSRHKMPFSLQDLPGKIMRKAWENRHIPGMLEAFARTVVSTILRFDGLFGRRSNTYPSNKELDRFEQAFVDDTQVRRELILLTLPHLLAKDVEASRLRITWPPIVISEDFDWLLELLDSETDEPRRSQYTELVARLAYYDIEKVYEASQRHQDLNQLTKHAFVSVLNHPSVISKREHFREMKEIEETQKRELAEVRPSERIQEALERFETGATWQWLNLIYALSVGPPSGASWQIEPDLTEFPNWKSCNDILRIRIIQNALTYVLRFEYRSSDSYDENWYFTNQISHAEIAGYRALFLLLKMSTITLDEIPFARWRKWSKIIVWFPLTHIILNDGRTADHERTRDQQLDLLRRLYRIAQPALLENLRDLLTAEDGSDLSIGQTLDKVEHLWDSALEATLLDLLYESSLSAKGQRSLLDFLLKRENVAAVAYAEEFISSGYSDEEQKCLLIEFCTSLMASASKYDWMIVWNVISSCDDLGKAIVENVAKEERLGAKFGAHLNARELADLYIWTQERYPSSEDPQIDGVHVVETREQVGRWRNNIIAELRKKNRFC